ncbi:uncharacterized protein C9orf57 homolog [Saccopteryx bilineata]|uniref:uncharacterized protein C9orf57 homolog n=1 Tax=Saccopteryx bilineata TaxID=59482 RepID=UPI00338DAB90
MRRIVFGGVFVLFCLLDDFGTCKPKAGQSCIKEVHSQGGVDWYSVMDCTDSQEECGRRSMAKHTIETTFCCNYTLCNL